MYLEDKAVATAEAGYELALSFASVMGCDPRTQGFYEHYGTYVDKTWLIREFLEKGGMDAFVKALSTVSIER